jgi:hypothetical protein
MMNLADAKVMGAAARICMGLIIKEYPGIRQEFLLVLEEMMDKAGIQKGNTRATVVKNWFSPTRGT